MPRRSQTSQTCKTLHARILRLGLRLSGKLGSALVDLYSKSGDLGHARIAVDRLEERDGSAWSSVLSGRSVWGSSEEVVGDFRSIRCSNGRPDQFGLAVVLSACARLDALNYGRAVHCDVVKDGFGSSSFCEGALVDMYSKCDRIADAQKVFDGITHPDTISWTNMIAGYVRVAMCSEALELFFRMEKNGGVPDQVTYVTVISACVSSGKLDDAKSLFTRMNSPNTVAYNAIISGYTQNGLEDDALGFYKEMRRKGLRPTRSTLGSVLSAAANLTALDGGRQIHSEAIRFGLDSNVYVGSALINIMNGRSRPLNCLGDAATGVETDEFTLLVYLARCFLESSDFGRQLHCAVIKSNLGSNSKMIEDANELFAEMPHTDSLVLWTAIISGHAQNGCSDEALSLFWKMRSCNVRSDEAAFASVLGACADLASITDGKEVHSLIIKSGFASYGTASSALVDMYSKCGDVHSSFKVFENMENKEDIISWNSMIVGLAKNGYAPEALTMFQKMRESNIEPDDVTFLGVLTACAHAGLVSEGRHFFDSMTEIYRIAPRLDHYACMVDLLGRVGHLKEAQDFIERSPFEPDSVIWATFLAACRTHNDEIRGKIAAEKLAELEPTNSSTYILLSNLFASSGNWSGAKMVREAMRERGVRKSPGCSWITVGNKTSLFLAGDKFHPDSVIIYEILSDLIGVMKQHEHVNEYELLWLDEGLG
ncbi:Pentatricopeptide repeat-containing protein, mitochondrial [Ananas comosus]|uniref:Pentatricopeptide repeat-containing protein, mitochondrial n=1 Tax=Ananas comosus TaxID=4615 RepID=A0A199UTV9_ANACO|nr:Pentatricopeptide repeat-containing protein, mitochondrial [Ananas comosus]